MLWPQTIDNLKDATDLVRRRRYGVIRVESGTFHSLTLRPWPKLISRLEIETLGRWKHSRGGDHVRLYYNFPLSSPGFLTLAYIESTQQTTWKTLRRSLEVLDWVAQVRGANASVCELSNEKISTRLMGRLGWEPHCEQLAGRHFIKRFYGQYPRHAWLPVPTETLGNFRRDVRSLDLAATFADSEHEIDLVDDRVGC
ncbi:hypothetical protein C5Y96_15505 [Blastopirellula marina]|uniref:Uncharacterized protein n=1 Tax=Blastopirellula marina TaxID=124 RepID=A0A2S8FAI6_9BACT|nr:MULTISPECIES: hypothetical protein [Pirellulaceae]PQO29159.1 hypothetical protein C5Y96_15505 [Blastopirellula marina]RCS50352.1 hypothetical protein DTL36_15525 [Bremerella cremea]